MTAEHLGRLFQAFSQADASTTRALRRHRAGAGDHPPLLSRWAATSRSRARPGWARRSPSGCRPPSAEPPPEPAEAARGRRLRPGIWRPGGVLVIDDDPALRELLRRFLAKEGFRVVDVGSGTEGLRQARLMRPAAILLDVQMSGMDGWSVLAALRDDPQLSGIPVVMLSVVDDKQRGFALGAADYLVKPFDRQRLVTILARHGVPRGESRDTSPARAAGKRGIRLPGPLLARHQNPTTVRGGP